MRALLLMSVSALFSATAFASILPPNDLHLEDSVNFSGGISEEVFNLLIDKAERYYAPIVAQHGGKLVMKRLWENQDVNAGAYVQDGEWQVYMYGGLARRPETTSDAFAIVLCHELGHHLGGFPRFEDDGASSEGQADYFAAHSCVRKLWQHETIANELAFDLADDKAKAACDSYWKTQQEKGMCYRTAMAGRALASLLNQTAKKPGMKAPDFDTPAPKKVRKTFLKHPDPQCRLDTYLAAALCGVEFDENVIPLDEATQIQYSCTEQGQHEVGVRPRCWFKPGK